MTEHMRHSQRMPQHIMSLLFFRIIVFLQANIYSYRVDMFIAYLFFFVKRKNEMIFPDNRQASVKEV